ncbi:MAG: carboxypeptidase-like regulatory domain-containing protein [Rhizobacter sp.]|nr:carboxypeptidase-like regulatory domain-containing protein [Ferruginibacter sp.]
MSYKFQLQSKNVSYAGLQIIAAIGLLILFSFASPKYAVINGKILNESGKPVPFASVVIKGTSNGVQADAGGNFSMAVYKLPVTIIVEAIGYEKQELKLTSEDFKDALAYLAVTLKTRESHLAEVVVTAAYSSKRTSRSTSSSVSGEPMRELAGKVAGVSVSSGDAVFYKSTSVKEFSSDALRSITTSDSIKFTIKNATPVKAKLLTAGEVNDFKKWTMWEDYNEYEFKNHSEKWGLFATRRYAVQLQHKNLNALTGQKIYLIHKQNGDTIWTAVSDNTGKAELWDGFTGKAKVTDLRIGVEGEASTSPAIPFSQGINRIVIQKDCTISNRVEIAFVVDATGSMQDEIDYLKEELEDILLKITKKDPTLDLYSGAVFYRDKGDDYITVESGMKQGVSQVISFIKKQNAAGGGDFPEALNNGLKVALQQLKWSEGARTRIIFLLMDAPPHDEAKKEMADLIKQAAYMGIRIVPVACSGTDKATEFIMRSMALATNGTYLFLTDDSGIGNAHIKPTTDEFKVELLNNLMQRTIEQMCFVNSCTASTQGIEPLSPFTNDETVQLFPNPTRGMLTLKTTKKIKEIFLTDFAGKILLRKEMNNSKGDYSIDLAGFPSSTYFIKYVTTENTTGVEKLVLIR